MSKYSGLYTFDTDNHRYVTIAQADGIIDLLDTDDYVPAEPLIKNEEIRKALRAWAYVQRIKEVKHIEGAGDAYHIFEYGGENSNRGIIHWGRGVILSDLEDGKIYTIAELCGEEEE